MSLTYRCRVRLLKIRQSAGGEVYRLLRSNVNLLIFRDYDESRLSKCRVSHSRSTQQGMNDYIVFCYSIHNLRSRWRTKYKNTMNTKSSEPPRFRSSVPLAWGQPNTRLIRSFNTRKSSDIMCLPLQMPTDTTLDQTQNTSVQEAAEKS